MPRDLDDDAIYTKVVETYRKAIANALAVLEKNPRGRDSELAASYRFEVAFCDGLLPKGKDETEVLPLVRAKIAELSAGPGHIGKVVGAVMKGGYQGVSASMMKRLATQLLAEKDE